MKNLFSALRDLFPIAARCAQALGISRQAYQQANQRRRLSNNAVIRAAALLGIDPGQALLANATANTDAPIRQPAPTLRRKPAKTGLNITTNKSDRNTNYAKCSSVKKAAIIGPMKNVHVITSDLRAEQLDLVRWVFAVAGLPADSPRFAWYVSRWLVPEKIARAKAAGTFESAVSNCKPISPDWLRFVPAAMDAYREFIQPNKPKETPRTFSPPKPSKRKLSTIAA